LFDQLAKSKLDPTSIGARLVIVKQLMQSSLWFVLTLCVLSRKELKKLDRKIVRFIWAGQKDKVQRKVNYQTIIKPRMEGGLGYISLEHQVDGMAGNLFSGQFQMDRQTPQSNIAQAN
jgi:hypothetical protein